MAVTKNISDKVFIVNRSQLERRAEPEFYAPSIYNIEATIRRKAKKRLSDFIIKMASGATPLIADSVKHYTDETSGVPFLRVQNLQTNGSLYLADIKYIHLNTHKTSLKRSQVGENDLLIKITGVGRMAIASVPPVGFVGNTNQHMVVIKTESRDVSEYLANYLNLDIIEKLATRRSAGGTRPALDYTALKSMPIIEGLDFSELKIAETQKQQKEAQAKKLLESIDTYLLNELGITLHTKKSYAKDRIFLSSFKEVVGSRIDPKLYDNNTKEIKNAISNSNYPKRQLKDLLIQSAAGDWGIEDGETELEGYTKCLVIRATEFDNNGNLSLDNSRVKYRMIKNEKLISIDVKKGDLLIEKSGGSPDQPVGRVALITKEYMCNNRLGYSNFIHKIRLDESEVIPEYAFYFLKAVHNMKLTDAMQSQTNGIRNLIMSNYFNQNIVLPSITKQDEIVNHIKDIQKQITKLKADATSILENAKAEVEKMILG